MGLQGQGEPEEALGHSGVQLEEVVVEAVVEWWCWLLRGIVW